MENTSTSSLSASSTFTRDDPDLVDPDDHKALYQAYTKVINCLRLCIEEYEVVIPHLKEGDPLRGPMRDNYEMFRQVRLAFECVDRLYDYFPSLAIHIYGDKMAWYNKHMKYVPELDGPLT